MMTLQAAHKISVTDLTGREDHSFLHSSQEQFWEERVITTMKYICVNNNNKKQMGWENYVFEGNYWTLYNS